MSGSTPRTAIVTGSGGLIGSEAARRLTADGYKVVGVDNDMRRHFFGEAGSTLHVSQRLVSELGRDFSWRRMDIRDADRVLDLYREVRPELVIHAAAQPAHDWAARDPLTDFGVNATGTLNLLVAHRRWVPDSTFVHCSTSKVYGDNPNRLPLVEQETRYDLPEDHQYFDGIDATMSIDQCLHSLFGASKAAGDLVVQEFGRYFDIPTVCFRPGCLTGADHAGVELHGWLSYLGKATARGLKYRIFGHKGKQVRCDLHSQDLVSAFLAFHESPRAAAVYNIGGGRENAASMLEAIEMFENATDKKLDREYVDEARIGDHVFWISSNADFERDYPSFRLTRLLPDVVSEIAERWAT